MTEAWDSLAAARAQREACSAEIDQIKKSCNSEHEKQHVAECAECYPQILDRIKALYLENSEFEWLPGRQDSLAELRTMFADAKDYKIELEAIDSRIEAEKKQVYLQKLKTNPAIRKALEDILERRSLLSKIRAGDSGFEDLVKEVRSALNQGSEQSQESLENIFEKLNSAKAPQERREIYSEAFLKEGPDQKVSARNQKYLDSLNNGSSLESILNQVLSDRRASLAAQDQKEKHKRRLGELRRARTAHELQKTKKKGGGVTTGPQPPDWLYNIPPCFVCSKAPDSADVIACGLCEVLVDAQIQEQPVVFCSTECEDRGQQSHVEESHSCASGEDCVQVHEEDVDMDAEVSSPVLCKTCTTSLKVESLFCSEKCAKANFQRHREGVHIPKWEYQGEPISDAEQLEYEDEEKTKYHALDLQSHIVPVGIAIEEFRERNDLQQPKQD